jgi:DNA-directed RNA polymerase specialized sigma24 family protein
MQTLRRPEQVLRNTLRGDQSHSQPILNGGGAMSDTLHFPDEPLRDPPLEWQRAVRIALRLLARRYSTPCPDLHEWKRDCQQEAYVAIAEAAPRYACPDPPSADPTWHQILWLANHAYNALRRFWRQEAQYYAHTVPMVVEEEAGEALELEFEDEVAQAAVLDVLEQVFCAQVLERLSPYLDEKDWLIVAGLADGQCQEAIAQELGITQSAVSKRLGALRRLARAILGELRCEWL